MENFAVEYNGQADGVFTNADADITAFLTHLFAPATANYNQLVLELQREFRHGGSPDVARIRFDRVTFDPDTARGRFRVMLDVSFTFGCEDSVTEKKDQTSEWTFVVDRANSKLLFYSSPFAESRSTADEF